MHAEVYLQDVGLWRICGLPLSVGISACLLEVPSTTDSGVWRWYLRIISHCHEKNRTRTEKTVLSASGHTPMPEPQYLLEKHRRRTKRPTIPGLLSSLK